MKIFILLVQKFKQSTGLKELVDSNVIVASSFHNAVEIVEEMFPMWNEIAIEKSFEEAFKIADTENNLDVTVELLERWLDAEIH